MDVLIATMPVAERGWRSVVMLTRTLGIVVVGATLLTLAFHSVESGQQQPVRPARRLPRPFAPPFILPAPPRILTGVALLRLGRRRRGLVDRSVASA